MDKRDIKRKVSNASDEELKSLIRDLYSVSGRNLDNATWRYIVEGELMGRGYTIEISGGVNISRSNSEEFKLKCTNCEEKTVHENIDEPDRGKCTKCERTVCYRNKF